MSATTQERQQVTVPFAPRDWQKRLLADKSKRIVAVVHRRAGKSTALMWMGLKRALTERKPNARVVHILPYGVMWQRTGLWDQLAQAAESIPGAIVRRSELAIRLPNGSVFQCGGADNVDSWRGGGADLAIVDEFDDTPPSLVPLVIEPMLADRNGTLVRSGTPKGRGLLQAAYDRAKVTPEYSAYLLDHTATGALNDEAVATLRREMTEEEFAQELECSFASPNSGSYYGKLMDQADRDGRITKVPHDPALKVWTAWDLGVHDSTAIWCLQLSRGGEWRLIDYIEDSGAGLDHYARILAAKPYLYEKHLLPHDAQVRELGSGRTRTETLHGLGVRPTRGVGAHSVADGINAVRMVLPRAWFDAERCAKGISALRHYRREWNEAAQTWRSSPVHDNASHGCLTGDALVLTDRGHRRIDAMQAGDRVWTPAGHAVVEWAGLVKRAAELVQIELADGRKLQCTPEHKIATQRGFVCADTLRYLDTVLSGNEWQSFLIGLYSRVKSTGYRATITDATSGGPLGLATFTELSGRAVTGLCRRAARYITETATRSTTRWTISNAWMPQSISGSTPWNGTPLGSSSHQLTFAGSELPNGMHRPKASSGTARTAGRPGKTGSGTTRRVSSVVRCLLRLGRSKRSGVTSIARWKTCDNGADGQSVYDLTVRSHACYQANGFLVSNSDSFRYLCLGVREDRPSPIDAEKFAPPPARWTEHGHNTSWMSI